MWENLGDPIISGREEIGHPKLFAEIEDARVADGRYACAAQWLGFRFLDIEVSALSDAGAPPAPMVGFDGTRTLKYLPRTGAWGEADVCEVTLTSAANSGVSVERRQCGQSAVRFHHARWTELPTMFHVVNALADLPVLEPRGGLVTWSRGPNLTSTRWVLR